MFMFHLDRFAAQDPSVIGKGAKAVFRDKQGMHYTQLISAVFSVIYLYTHATFCANSTF
jgi:hypothetical protein